MTNITAEEIQMSVTKAGDNLCSILDELINLTDQEFKNVYTDYQFRLLSDALCKIRKAQHKRL